MFQQHQGRIKAAEHSRPKVSPAAGMDAPGLDDQFVEAKEEATGTSSADPMRHYMKSVSAARQPAWKDQEQVILRLEESRAKVIDCLLDVAPGLMAFQSLYRDVASGAVQSLKVLELSSTILGRLPSNGKSATPPKKMKKTPEGPDEEGEQADPPGRAADNEKIRQAAENIVSSFTDLMDAASTGKHFLDRKASVIAALVALPPKDKWLGELVETSQRSLGPHQEALDRAQMYFASMARDKEQLFEANMRFVVFIARSPRYDDRGLHLSDRIQEGNIGLLRAINKFRSGSGAKLTTYAGAWIEQAIERALADIGHTIRVPVHVREKMNKIHYLNTLSFNDTGRDATEDELADKLRITPNAVKKLLNVPHEPASLAIPLAHDSEACLGDIIEDKASKSPQTSIIQDDLRDQIQKAIATLPPKEARVLVMRYGIGGGTEHTYAEAAEALDVPINQVRMLEAKALRKLKYSAAYLDERTEKNGSGKGAAAEGARPGKKDPAEAVRPTPTERTMPAFRRCL